MCSSYCSGPSWHRANAPSPPCCASWAWAEQAGWHQHHRVLSRAKWSARAASRLLPGQLVAPFLPAGPLVFGLDETRERRWGPRIAARGIDRDAVRSTDSHLVKCRGLRWLSVCLLTSLPRAARSWALPVLTGLAPSAGWATAQGRRRKKSRIGSGK